jgi:CBS domain-containing protein
MTEYRVGSIMRANGPTLAPDTPIRRAVALLVEARTAAAVVCDDNGRLVGILTQKDCFRPALHASYYQEWTGQVFDYMTREAVTVDVDDEIISVAETFMAYPHRVFPVRDGETVKGMIHRSDVLALLMRIG